MASTFQLNTMILPQLENNTHLVDVLGMFSLMTISCVFKSNPFGERLAKIAKKKMLLMVCDQCAVRRGLADGTLNNVVVDKLRLD